MKKITVLYLVSILSLFLYSFTQVDLGLALTRFPFLFSVQRVFQAVGYFNRPLSSLLYIMVLVLLFISYLIVLRLLKNGKFKKRDVWRLIIITAGILLFSYNAFSHDLFNYIFDAKIFTFYGKNPYLYKALDFAGDPMLAFMHWTHRTFPYGPVWLFVTIPLSYLGFNIFILNFILFKFLAVVSYLGSVYFIEKIANKLYPSHALFISGFFAFSPLVLIEGLVSGHIDIFMIFTALISLYFLIQNRYILMLVFLFISIGVKFATIFLLPVFLVVLVLQIMKIKVPWKMVFFICAICLSLSIIAASQQSGNFQPWYLLVIIPFLAFLSKNQFISIGSHVISAGALLAYLPFLYFGNWDEPVPTMLNQLYLILAILLTLIGVFGLFKNSKFKIQNLKLKNKKNKN